MRVSNREYDLTTTDLGVRKFEEHDYWGCSVRIRDFITWGLECPHHYCAS